MNAKIAIKLIETNKLNTDQMLDVGNKANNWHVWQAVVENLSWDDLNIDQMLDIGNKANNWHVWQAVVEKLQ